MVGSRLQQGQLIKSDALHVNEVAVSKSLAGLLSDLWLQLLMAGEAAPSSMG